MEVLARLGLLSQFKGHISITKQPGFSMRFKQFSPTGYRVTKEAQMNNYLFRVGDTYLLTPI